MRPGCGRLPGAAPTEEKAERWHRARLTPMSPLWIACAIVLAAAVVVFRIRRHARLGGVCAECGRTIRRGALKCPACGMWFAGRST